MEVTNVSIVDLAVKTPFRMTVSGPSSSGKTRWIQRFLKHYKSITNIDYDVILYMYGEYQTMFEEIKTNNSKIVWCEGFDHTIIESNLKLKPGAKLLIIDDLLQEVAEDKFFHTFYVRRSHHWNVSVIFTTQYLHQKGLRLVNLNTTHYILFKSLRDQTPVRTLGLQIYPTKWRSFVNIYSHCTR